MMLALLLGAVTRPPVIGTFELMPVRRLTPKSYLVATTRGVGNAVGICVDPTGKLFPFQVPWQGVPVINMAPTAQITRLERAYINEAGFYAIQGSKPGELLHGTEHGDFLRVPQIGRGVMSGLGVSEDNRVIFKLQEGEKVTYHTWRYPSTHTTIPLVIKVRDCYEFTFANSDGVLLGSWRDQGRQAGLRKMPHYWSRTQGHMSMEHLPGQGSQKTWEVRPLGLYHGTAFYAVLRGEHHDSSAWCLTSCNLAENTATPIAGWSFLAGLRPVQCSQAGTTVLFEDRDKQAVYVWRRGVTGSGVVPVDRFVATLTGGLSTRLKIKTGRRLAMSADGGTFAGIGVNAAGACVLWRVMVP